MLQKRGYDKNAMSAIGGFSTWTTPRISQPPNRGLDFSHSVLREDLPR
jgi:hypothetical protein